MLNATDVYKVFYPGTPDERIALDEVSLHLAPSDFAVIIGGNGAGKSTLLNTFAGELPVDGGSIVIDGTNVTGLPTHRRAGFVSRVFQDPSVGTAATLTIEENLAVAALRGANRGFGRGLTSRLREEFRDHLASFGLGLENRMTAQVGLLSGGQRQALSLLMAVLRQPRVLLLDEHTAALDPRTAEAVMQATSRVVGQASLTTLMVTHNMHHAIAHGNRLIMMQQGRIIADLNTRQKQGLTVERLVAAFEDESKLHELESAVGAAAQNMGKEQQA